MPEFGQVFLVGAGPGDPQLLTLRGRKLLEHADIVYYDYLVNPLMLSHCRPATELVCLGSHTQGRVLSQDEINQRVIASAKEGKTVVRLKGGDPTIFGRSGEEIAAFEAEGIAYEMVPGVTAALAASSYAGVPLTHRDYSSCVAFITGHECRGKDGSSLDLANLAKFPGTLVFYMGVTTAPYWASELVAHGKTGQTPVAIVRHCSLSKQEKINTTLAELPEVLAPGKVRPPCIIIVGDVVGAQPEVNWFTSKPLFGQNVVVTRPEHQATEMVLQLSDLGANVLIQPAIEISPVKDFKPLDSAIENLESFDWLVFSSANGVHYFIDRLSQNGHDLRKLSGVKLAAIGPATARALSGYHLAVDLQPKAYRAEALAEGLIPAAQGQRVLLLRASRGREVLAESLAEAGIEVEQVVVYQSTDITKPKPEVVQALAGKEIAWITVTSSAIARSLIGMFGESLKNAKLAAISPLTANVLRDAGFPPQAVAEEFTTQGLIEVITKTD